MKKRSVTYFALRLLMIASLPVLLFVALYVATDPYHILRHTDTLPDMVRVNHGRLGANKGLLSVEALKRRVAQGDVPDSFIFGASISCYYEIEEWQKYINAAATPMHFDSASEGAESLLHKLKYLRRNGIGLKNALIILSPYTLQLPLTGDQVMSVDPPEIAGWQSTPYWYYVNFRSFCDIEFLKSYVPAIITGKKENHGYKTIFEVQPMTYNPYINEEYIPQWDIEIAQNPDSFINIREFPTEKRLHCSNAKRIDNDRRKVYEEIATMLQDVDYHVIVSPTIDLDTLSAADDRLLRSIFKPGRFHNYTVTMAPLARDNTNWYDHQHYRATMTRPLLKATYNL